MRDYTTTERVRLLDLKAAIEELNEKMVDLSYFRFRVPYIEQAVKAGRYQERKNWQEIARLLAIRKEYEEELKQLEWIQCKGDFDQVVFYRFLTPVAALIAMKKGKNVFSFYDWSVCALGTEKPLVEEITFATVLWEMSRQKTEEGTFLCLEEMESELEEISKCATLEEYRGSVISINGQLI